MRRRRTNIKDTILLLFLSVSPRLRRRRMPPRVTFSGAGLRRDGTPANLWLLQLSPIVEC